MTQHPTPSFETVPAPPPLEPITEPRIAVQSIQNMLEYAMTHRGITCLWVSQFHRQALNAFNDVVRSFVTPEIQRAIKTVEPSFLTITLKNGSKLYFYTVENSQYIRGLRLSWVGFSDFIDLVIRQKLYEIIVCPALWGNDALVVNASGPLEMKGAVRIDREVRGYSVVDEREKKIEEGWENSTGQ